MKFFIFLLCLVVPLFSNHPLETISLQLSWRTQFQSAGFYVAQEKGFYTEAGLEVTIKELTQDLDITQEVLDGKSTYGVGKSSLIIDKAHGKEVVALMALFQHSPSVLITTDPSIQTLQDFKNKRIMITSLEANSAPMMAMLLSGGVKAMTIQPHSFTLQDLIDGKTDALASYSSNEPFLLEQAGVDYRIFDPHAYGFSFYGDILFTSAKEINTHPKRAKAFYDATKKGWEWAFEHIEESANILHERYNTQGKSLEALRYEGNALKKLAYAENKPFGLLEPSKIEAISNTYTLTGSIPANCCFEEFIDPLAFGKKEIRIGILANQSNPKRVESWHAMARYLSNILPLYSFSIIPLSFDALTQSAQEGDVDFIITNPIHFIQLGNRHGLSRIATLSLLFEGNYYSQFGSVIVSRKNNPIQNLSSLPNNRIGAVHSRSFGGYYMALKELNLKEGKHTFLGTHEAVIEAVLSGNVDVGIVRTGVLETLHKEGKINIDDLTILHQKENPQSPWITSTALYPEWALAKHKHTDQNLANAVLSALLDFPAYHKAISDHHWNIPLDYSSVQMFLREMQLYPYEPTPFKLSDLFYSYRHLFLGLAFAFSVLLVALFMIRKLNTSLLAKTKEIALFNKTLEKEVETRTQELRELNGKLETLANTDELTQIANRRYFLELASLYFDTSKRQNTSLFVLSLDIDFFKRVNDTYGHSVGDVILQLFCQSIQDNLRSSDLFGRIGGEEFCVCFHSETPSGAMVFAEKLRHAIESISYTSPNNETLHVTVSIGMSEKKAEDTSIFDLIKRSDEALYQAKNNGRNQVCFTQTNLET